MTTNDEALKALDRILKQRIPNYYGGYDPTDENIIRTALLQSSKVDWLVESLKFYADKSSYEFIHGTAVYMPIEVDGGYKATEALHQFHTTEKK